MKTPDLLCLLPLPLGRLENNEVTAQRLKTLNAYIILSGFTDEEIIATCVATATLICLSRGMTKESIINVFQTMYEQLKGVASS